MATRVIEDREYYLYDRLAKQVALLLEAQEGERFYREEINLILDDLGVRGEG